MPASWGPFLLKFGKTRCSFTLTFPAAEEAADSFVTKFAKRNTLNRLILYLLLHDGVGIFTHV